MAQQIFVRVLDGRTRCLLFDDDASRDEGVSVARLARELERLEGILRGANHPCGSRVLRPADGRLPLDPPTCHLLLPSPAVRAVSAPTSAPPPGTPPPATSTRAEISAAVACDTSTASRRSETPPRAPRNASSKLAALRHINSRENQTKRKFSEIEAEERERYAREAADTVAGTAEATRLGLAAAARADADAAARADAARAAEKPPRAACAGT